MARSTARPFTTRWLFVACLALPSALALRADALERPPAPNNHGYERAPEGSFDQGLYVIGDSISALAPYPETGTALGEHVWMRVGFGWTAMAHRTVVWPADRARNVRASFEDAAQSSAKVVYVQLGTNDTSCMRAGGWCGNGFPATPEAANAERWLWLGEAVSAIQTLTDKGKCVLWAGPREIERPDSGIEEPRAFNDMLRVLEGMFPGKFYYVDYSGFSFQNEALRHSLDTVEGADGIHPMTTEGLQAVANLAFWHARLRCGL